MSTLNSSRQKGSTLLVALSTILVLSLAGAGVLMNSTTRYNVTTAQVKGWKDALFAAEAGGDIGFAEVRKKITNPGTEFATAHGWVSPAPAPLPSSNSWALGHGGTPRSIGAGNSMTAKITVDRVGFAPGSSTVGYYRIRSIGSSLVTGLRRTGMDNRMNLTTKGDNLLRMIDFNHDRYRATYGHGDSLASDPATPQNGKLLTTVSQPQSTRRIELIATPVMPIEGAVKTAQSFRGTTVDSYDSKNPPKSGTNPPSSFYGHSPSGADAIYAVDARDGDVIVGNSTFSAGMIYGDISTNGGNATTNKATGVVDNNVPIDVPPAVPGTAPIPLLPGMFGGPTAESGSLSTINPPTRISSNGALQTTFWYTYTDLEDVTINPLTTANGTPIDTTVNIYVLGDVDGLTVNEGVTANIYFRGDMDGKARDYDNFNADGPLTAWQWFYANSAARTAATGFVPEDVGKLAYQDGNPGSYWRLTDDSPVTWASQSVSNVNYVVCSHITPTWSYANAAARTSVTGFVQADVDKVAYQTDTQSYYRLAAFAPITWMAMEPYSASPLVSRAGHVWFYGISPSSGTRTIAIGPPGPMWAAFYAPGHDFSSNGNPDFYGVMVAKSFYMNGNNTFHFDKQLLNGGTPLDYRVASYIEDIR